MDIVACEILSSARCNMSCVYCYIPKTPEAVGWQQQVTDYLSSGRWIDDLSSVVGINLEHLGLWGTEPTITLHLLIPQLGAVLKAFPGLKTIGLSSNFLQHIEKMIELARNLSMLTNKMELRIQVSLDGPEWVTDRNRCPGATKAVLANLERFWCEMDREAPGISIKMHFKPTLSIDNMRAMDGARILEWFSFFDRILDTYSGLVRDKGRLGFAPHVAPTFVLPGTYTSDDGKDAADFFKRIWEVERQSKFKHLRGSFNDYVGRFQRLVRTQSEFLRHPSIGTCSAADTSIGLGFEHMHMCHETFMMIQPDYLKAVDRDPRVWEVSHSDAGRVSIARRYIVNAKASDAFSRFRYVMRNYHDFYTAQISYGVAMLKELAAAGQVSAVYGEREEVAALLALFVATAFSCPAENILNTGCLHFAPVSLYRLLGNGVFENVLEQYLARRSKV